MSLIENDLARKSPWQRVQILMRSTIGVQILAAIGAMVIAFGSAHLALEGYKEGATSAQDQGVRDLAGRIGGHAGELAVQIDRLQDIIKTDVSDPQLKAKLQQVKDGMLKPYINLKVIGEVYSTFGLPDKQPEKKSQLQFIGPANAQTIQSSNQFFPAQKLTMDDVRIYGVVTILSCLGLGFFLCIGIILFSDNARRLTFAIDTVKVLLGFFVGVATSFFGVSGH